MGEDARALRGRLPTFLIIGAMRSGTSTLARWLVGHPEVFLAPGKELHFFDRYFDRGITWYSSLFAGADRESAVGEATPNYIHEPAAIERIAATLPEVRLILSLRNPVDRAYSHYWHNRSREKEHLTFEKALDAEPIRTASSSVDRARFSYVSRGQYLDQINQVLRWFHRSSLYVVVAEEMQSDPNQSLTGIFSFLGVNEHFQPESPERRVNAYTEFRSVRARNLAKRLPRILARPISRLNASTSNTYPPMDPDIRARLEETFEAGNRKLADFLGRTEELWPRLA